MGNTSGMFSANNLPPGVTKLRKPASFYSDSIGENLLSRLVGIHMNWGGVADLVGFTTRERLRKANSDGIIHLCLEQPYNH